MLYVLLQAIKCSSLRDIPLIWYVYYSCWDSCLCIHNFHSSSWHMYVLSIARGKEKNVTMHGHIWSLQVFATLNTILHAKFSSNSLRVVFFSQIKAHANSICRYKIKIALKKKEIFSETKSFLYKTGKKSVLANDFTTSINENSLLLRQSRSWKWKFNSISKLETTLKSKLGPQHNVCMWDLILNLAMPCWAH